MDRRARGGRTYRKRLRRGLGKRGDLLEARAERLGAVRTMQGGMVVDGRSCCDDLIGCLDDCVIDVKELRRRVRYVRS
jgi:hypothetical protein